VISHDEHRLDVEVVGIEEVAVGVRAVHLAQVDGADLPPWTPGAHIDVQLGPLTRQYSLCSRTDDLATWRIGVLLEPESRGGSQFVHGLERGDKLAVVGPRNNFILQPAAEYLFVAGGIGITPLLPMIAAVEAQGLPWRLLYGGRQRASMAFLPELAAYDDRVLIAPQDEGGHPDIAGALARCGPGVHVYCCGPEPLVGAVEQRTQALPAGSTHVERFRPRAADPEAAADAAFEVVLERSGVTVQVPADEAIVDSLLRAGVVVDTSCREGICGSCETRVLGGVPLHRDSLLSDEEQATNETMMVCVGRSRTPRLVLDL
jgi:ferredoxin-NADP reductase